MAKIRVPQNDNPSLVKSDFREEKSSTPDLDMGVEKIYEIPPEAKHKEQVNATLSRNNSEKLAAAIEHLKAEFYRAAGLQIGGRKFYGRTIIEVVWENSEAQEIRPEISARDRVVRSGR